MSGALSLVFETSTPHASLVLAGPGGILAQRKFSSDRNHNAMLFEPLSELMQGENREHIGLVLVGSGPGSYSGTRVGIAAAQGVAIALGCPAVAVPSILAVPSADGGAPCLAIGDARRGSFWWARMEHSNLASEPALCDANELAELVLAAVANRHTVFSFEAADRFPLPEMLAAAVIQEFPDAGRLWKTWLAVGPETRAAWSAQIPQPLYLKPPHITPSKRAPLLCP